MFKQLFGKYLVEQKALTAEQYAELSAQQAASRVKLGLIAVEEKLLTQEQADELNRLQTQMDKRFGDLAVEKGYLTDEQVGILLKKQGNPYLQFIQVLSESNYIPLFKIDSYLLSFLKDSNFSSKDLTALKSNDMSEIVKIFVPEDVPNLRELIGLTLRNITRFVSTDFYIGKIIPVHSVKYNCFAGQQVEGDHSYTLGFACEADNSGLLTLASCYGKEDFTDVNADAYDSIGEFSNCINGLFASELSHTGINIDMLPPFGYTEVTLTGDGYALPINIEGKDLILYAAIDTEIQIEGESAVAENVASTEAVGNAGPKVLIVDDSRTSRKILRAVLEEAGYTVADEALNGAEGVEKYKQIKPALCTMDITMPVMDGIEALKAIREFDPDAKVVMLTAAGQQSKIVEAVKAGAAEFITKPFEKDEVIRTLSEIIK